MLGFIVWCIIQKKDCVVGKVIRNLINIRNKGRRMIKNFYQEQKEQSQVKARIIADYFSRWAQIILNTQKKNPRHSQRMAYIDLFAGPGRYDDQSKSTPLLVLETILADSELANRTLTLFNDKDAENIESLKDAIGSLENIEKLKHKPVFYNSEVGEEIAEMFKSKQIIPTFFFVDPWGYKGLSLKLVASIVKDWGCDCVFFLNYNRVNMGINNEAVKPHMISLFGEDRLNTLQQECEGKSPEEREKIVIKALCIALENQGSQYVLPFRFKNVDGTRTSHYLVFLSKHFRGYDNMKTIMFKESSEKVGGVASYEYNPLDIHSKQGSLFDALLSPLDELKNMLTTQYAGKTIRFDELYEEHSVNTPYIKNNYKEVCKALLEEGKITAVHVDTGKTPRKGTFADKMQIVFKD